MTDKKIPLFKTTHWRRLKTLLNQICTLEKINLSTYDVDNIVCYTIEGANLKGSNVKYSNKDNYSCWVSDNVYDIYEIPSKSNTDKFKCFGDFLVLAHNTSFDYWLLCKLHDTFEIKDNRFREFPTYTVYGKYAVSVDGSKISFSKVEEGQNVVYGYLSSQQEFDAFNKRKANYNVSISEIIGKGAHNISDLKGGDIVKHYQKKNTKKIKN